MSETSEPPRSCAYVIGEDGLARWSDRHGDAWTGLLETHKSLVRTLDSELDARHGLTLSALDILGRLADAEGRCLRLSALAAGSGLSLSRVSRIVDALEGRGLITRRACEHDARAVEAHLSPRGLSLARQAQSAHFAAVEERFLSRLAPHELDTLAEVFARFAPHI